MFRKYQKVNKGNWRKKEKMGKIRIIKEFREYAERERERARVISKTFPSFCKLLQTINFF